MVRAEHSVPKEPLSRIRPNIQNEYSRLEQVLVVPTPKVITTFTDIGVNPIHAATIAGAREKIIEHPEAAEKHRSLLSTLENQGIELVYSHVTSIKEGHTPLFTRDVGIIIGDKVLPSRMGHDYRSVEVQGLIDVIDPKSIVQTDRDYMIEGGDIAVLGDGTVLVGIGPRTNINGLQLLQENFPEKEFVPVYPVDPNKAFHIDTVLGVLGNKTLLYLPGLVPEDMVGSLKEKGFNFIEADINEYGSCCTNVLAINDKKVIAPAENTETNRRMSEAGIDVVEVALSGILDQGGGPHCLTLPLRRSS